MRYIIIMVVLLLVIFWILMSDLEHSSALRWITSASPHGSEAGVSPGVTVIEEGYQYGWLPESGRLLWVAYSLEQSALQDNEGQQSSHQQKAANGNITSSGDGSKEVLLLDILALTGEGRGQTPFPAVVRLEPSPPMKALWHEYIWQCRYWLEESDRLYVVNGPVVDSLAAETWFSAIVRETGSGREASGFLLDISEREKPILRMAVSIDSIERLTGIDLFADLFAAGEVDRMEKSIDVLSWGYEIRRYEERIERIRKLESNEEK